MSTPNALTVTIDKAGRRFGRRWALGGVDLQLEPGAGCMLTGNNGSGKSTLLRCVATALKLHHGQITINGEDLWTHRSRYRPQIAYLSHAGALYDDLSGLDNLKVWAQLGGYSQDLSAILTKVGLDPTRHDPVRTFSAGMRRRLALGRVLLKQPAIALFDEPYSALDPDGRDLVTRIANELRASGATLIMATHLPTSAKECCDRRVHLESGLIQWQGAADAHPEGMA